MHFRWLLAVRNALGKTQGTGKVTRVATKKPRMTQNIGDNKNKVFKVVLTGGETQNLHSKNHNNRAHVFVYIFYLTNKHFKVLGQVDATINIIIVSHTLLLTLEYI